MAAHSAAPRPSSGYAPKPATAALRFLRPHAGAGRRRALTARLGTEAMEPIESSSTSRSPSSANTSAPIARRLPRLVRPRRPRNQARHGRRPGAGPRHDGAWCQGPRSQHRHPGRTCELPDPRHEPDVLFAGDENPFWKLRKTFRVPVVKLLEEEARERTAEEMKRLLYVALTRARHRLYIAGHWQQARPRQETWYR